MEHKKRLDWFPFQYLHYQHGTRFFTNEQKGIYVDLLCRQFERGFLSQAEMLGAIKNLNDNEKNQILEKFCEKSGEYRNIRMDEERKKAYKIHRLKVKAGQKGGLSRTQAYAQAKPSTAQHNTLHNNTLQNNKEKEIYKEKDRPPISKKIGTQWPKDFTLTPDRRAYAESKLVADVQEAWEQFEAWSKANGKTFKNWDQAWRNWCLSPYQRKAGLG